jgi:hypothetical protein
MSWSAVDEFGPTSRTTRVKRHALVGGLPVAGEGETGRGGEEEESRHPGDFNTEDGVRVS